MSAQPALTHNWFGDRVWRVNGIPHREDGPARVWPDGEAEWWRHGARVDPPEHQP